MATVRSSPPFERNGEEMKENIFYAKDLGAVNDGKTLNTAAVQSAIDKIAQSGGGKLVFSDGEYVLSTVFLKNNVHVVIEATARILGAPDFDDYCFHEKIDYPAY